MAWVPWVPRNPRIFEKCKMEPTDFEEKRAFIAIKANLVGQIYKWQTFGTHGLKFLTTPLDINPDGLTEPLC